MKKSYADGLREALQKKCPWATGQLRNSIQEALPYGSNGWLITIGNGTVMGLGANVPIKDANGKLTGKTRKVIRTVPSNQYAAVTNNAKTLKVFAKGKRDDPKVPKFTKVNNPNYHWATDAIKAYVEANKGSLVVNILEDEDE